MERYKPLFTESILAHSLWSQQQLEYALDNAIDDNDDYAAALILMQMKTRSHTPIYVKIGSYPEKMHEIRSEFPSVRFPNYMLKKMAVYIVDNGNEALQNKRGINYLKATNYFEGLPN